MKLKEEFMTHETDDGQIMVAAGGAGFSGLVRSNRTAAFIIDCLKTETTPVQIADEITASYNVSREVAEADVAKVIDTLRSIGALDE